MSVHVDEILNFLVARSAAPSTMGAQLERLRYGINSSPDPFRARDDVENHLLHQAALIRVCDAFSARQDFAGKYATLAKLELKSNPKVGQGYIAFGILRAYQEWATYSPERALVAVYHQIAKIAPGYLPPPPESEPDLLQAFRTNKAKRARSKAAESYADSLLALQDFVRLHNKNAARKSD